MASATTSAIDTVQGQHLTATVPVDLAGLRLDRALAMLFPDYSRTRLKEWIETGAVLVDGRPPRARTAVQGGEKIDLWPRAQAEERWGAQPIDIAIVYEDAELIVIDKPAGLVVHPGAGHLEGTLANALLHHDPAMATLPRAGIVHRLDKETSGLLVVARSPRARTCLISQLQSRKMTREYEAVVSGVLIAGGTVEAPVGRHPRERTRMAVLDRGREAITHYRVIRRFRAHTHLRLNLETGRTHQIRVHMAHICHPLLGDPEYGARLRLPPHASAEITETLRSFRRQALHAARLSLRHPATGESMLWQAALPEDMKRLLAALERDRREHPQP